MKPLIIQSLLASNSLYKKSFYKILILTILILFPVSLFFLFGFNKVQDIKDLENRGAIENIIKSSLVSSAKYGDIIYSRGSSLELGKNLGLIDLSICYHGQDLFVRPQDTRCKNEFIPNTELSHNKGILNGQEYILEFRWKKNRQSFFDQTVTSLILSFGMALILFFPVQLYLLNFILRKVQVATTYLIETELTGSDKNIDSKLDINQVVPFEFLSLAKFINSKAEELKLASEDKAIGSLAKQVSHDIRSPITALTMITSSLDNVPEEKRILIRNSVQRINDIANDLLGKSEKIANTDTQNLPQFSIELISPILDSIISEKRTQYRDRSTVDISIELNKSYGLFSKVNPTELKRVISNLINNAVEASESDKPIFIKAMINLYDKENLEITVKDNGKGIPLHILEKLGEKGVTEGKENSNSGSGLGVYHAKLTIESFGGKLIIESETADTPKRGSKFSIILPLSETPPWFVRELVLESDRCLISLDDDISIHQIWSGRLQSLVHEGEKNLEHLIYSSSDDFFLVAPSLIKNANVFLVDLELLGQSRTGLDVIEELSLTHPEIIKKTILVTSRFEEAHVRERCARLDIKLIPKAMAGFVPMKLQEARAVITNQYDAVLLDDDELVRMTWAYHAKKNSKKLKIYINAHELLSDLDQFDKRTHFFVDSNLGKDIDGAEIKGEVILEHLYKNGFTELFLCTGHESENFTHLKFIKNVFSKTPPF